MRISIQLPFFPGLYETSYKNSDTAYLAIKEELDYYQRDLKDEYPEYQHLTEDDLDFNDEEYDNDVTHAFVEVWANYAPDFVTDVEYDCLTPPRHYNFRNDELYAYITLEDGWEDEVCAFMKENYEWLKDRITQDWTSYDGFMSFMENDIKEWEHYLFEENDERYISTMIAYMMYRKNKGIKDDLLMATLEDIYAGSYVFITDEAKERLREMIESGEIKIPDPDQMEIPFAE